MAEAFAFRLLAEDGLARRGEIVTPRGIVRTPAFMPVGTVGDRSRRFIRSRCATPAPTSFSATRIT